MTAVRHLGFSKVGNFNFGPVRSPNMRHSAKFREDRLYRSRDIADFQFFKMAAAAILDFGNLTFLTVGTLRRVECVCVPNFVKIVQGFRSPRGSKFGLSHYFG